MLLDFAYRNDKCCLWSCYVSSFDNILIGSLLEFVGETVLIVFLTTNTCSPCRVTVPFTQTFNTGIRLFSSDNGMMTYS